MERSKKIKKNIINLILFISLIIITFTVFFQGKDVSQIMQLVGEAKKQYIFIGIEAMILYFACETINIGRILKELGEKSNFLRNYRYTLIGFFFSAITPAASGGQPMEIYYMYKDRISVAHSTLALLMQLWAVQIVTLTFGIISAVIHFDVLKSGLIWLFLLGIALNSSALALLFIGIFSKKLSNGLVKLCVKILKFFRIRKADEKIQKLEDELASYQESAKYIKAHRPLMIKTVLTTLVQMLVYYSVPYWVYLSFGFNTQNIWQILTLEALLYATVSGIPSPGAVGVSEGGFMGIFRNVFPEAMMGSAMLLDRGINFYLYVAISAIFVMISTLRDKKEIKEQQILLKEGPTVKFEEGQINEDVSSKKGKFEE